MPVMLPPARQSHCWGISHRLARLEFGLPLSCRPSPQPWHLISSQWQSLGLTFRQTSSGVLPSGCHWSGRHSLMTAQWRWDTPPCSPLKTRSPTMQHSGNQTIYPALFPEPVSWPNSAPRCSTKPRQGCLTQTPPLCSPQSRCQEQACSAFSCL